MMTTENKQKAKRTKFVAIEYNETKFYTDEIQKNCGKIRTVYYYDENQHTFCCEITPSYFLKPLYSYADYNTEAVNNMTDDERDQHIDYWDEQIRKGDADCDRGTYMHVSDVDAVDAKRKKYYPNLDGVYYKSEGRKYRELDTEAEERINVDKPFC